MNDDEGTERELVKLMAEHLGANEDEIVPAASLKDDLMMDSLDQIELVLAIEGRFDIELPDSEFEGVKTVEQVFGLVNKAVAARQ